MTNFDDDIRRISVLVNDLGDGRDGDAWDRCRVVLEAAGKVDKNEALLLLETYAEDGYFFRQVHSLLAALPDTDKESR
jgi:hypothetical protein